ncbi:MAG: FAD-dependent oxidoreductase [Peptococcaceae bacterium]|nr:FAD-dependent oxidoreductase [Candidatus Syntrophopropionicum ammoniitolerans]
MNDLLPPCTDACPVHTDVRGYLAAITRRDYLEAYRLIRANNPFPSVCAWVCQHPCEDSCRRAAIDAPLSIRGLKRFVVETVGPTFHFPKVPDSGYKVAVVGAGPAGLTAAHELVRCGHQVVVFDRLAAPGGHLLTSLPPYRLPIMALQRDIEAIKAAGVEILCGQEVGKDISLDRIKESSHAVILSTGLWLGRGLNLPGFDHPDVIKALPFLRAVNSDKKPVVGNRVVVIGGGDVAMDTARTALRLGASEVRVVCLESREEMPASISEIEDGEEEGVIIQAGYGPVSLTLEKDVVNGIIVQKILSLNDREGRFDPVYEPNSQVAISANTVILSIGQVGDNRLLKQYLPESCCRGSLPEAIASHVKGIFICGEMADGPGSAISAISSGRRTAELVKRYLEGKDGIPAAPPSTVVGPLPGGVAEKIPRLERQKMVLLPPEQRKKNFAPYEIGFDETAALLEAGRCLQCGQGATVNNEKCVACLNCFRLCPYDVPAVKDHAIISVEGCQACGVCAAVCPAGAISLTSLDNKEFLRLLKPFSANKDVALFACGGSGIDRLDQAGFDRDQVLARVRIIEVPTPGSLRLEWLLKVFENGAAGVVIVACEGAGWNRHAEGVNTIEGTILRARNLLQAVNIQPERLFYCRPGSHDELMDLLKNFVRHLEK